MKNEVPTEEQQITVTYWVPKDLDEDRRLAIYRRFRPLHDQFMRIVVDECRKGGYVPAKARRFVNAQRAYARHQV